MLRTLIFGEMLSRSDPEAVITLSVVVASSGQDCRVQRFAPLPCSTILKPDLYL
jgi:hypothetical protein